MIVGITGGVGSGKSTVLHALKDEFGAKILIADEFGHYALMKNSPCYVPIVNMFGGENILDEHGEIMRDKLSQIVYSDLSRLSMLNRIIHPYVWDCIENEIRKDPYLPWIFIESAILFEAGYEDICDQVWGVFSKRKTRIERLMKTRGYSVEKSERIMKKQMSEWEVRSRCDKTIENDGDLEYLRQQIRANMGIK